MLKTSTGSCQWKASDIKPWRGYGERSCLTQMLILKLLHSVLIRNSWKTSVKVTSYLNRYIIVGQFLYSILFLQFLNIHILRTFSILHMLVEEKAAILAMVVLFKVQYHKIWYFTGNYKMIINCCIHSTTML